MRRTAQHPCTARYVGKTEHTMSVRFKEHHNKATLPGTNKYASAIGQHARTTGHHFRPQDITYLAKDDHKLSRLS
jgi:hypothetical protein